MAKGATPTASREAAPARVLTMFEIDPAKLDPAVLDAIRKKNSAALPLTSILDPHKELCGLCGKGSSSADDVIWYLVTNGHHITGNLNMLMDLMPVFDRWVSCLVGSGPPMQVRARGSVNCNGIRLNDVWYVPECKVNVASAAQLGLILILDGTTCTIKRHDGVVVGEGRRKDNLYELDFLDPISVTPWYIVSNAAEHMTGNLQLLTNFTPTRPGRSVRTHAGAMLQVCGTGALNSKDKEFAVPGVSYVPGLAENIISVSQLTDSGFSITFGPHGCTVMRNHDGKEVGAASHSGGQLYQLEYLKVDSRK